MPAFAVPPFDVLDISIQPEQVDWGLEFLEVPDLWHLTGGEGVLVGVVDTGIATAHPDLGDAVVESSDFSGSDAGVTDEIGHGTHVAGIIGARHDGHGMVGVAPMVSLLNAKVLRSPRDLIAESAVAKAIRWCIEMEADLICLSLQSQRETPAVHEAVIEAVDAGVPTICAAGNLGPYDGTVAWPAAYPETIAVGYVSRDAAGNIDAGLDTSVGREIDLVAPGGDVLSTFPPNVWAVTSGSSMAAPFVCGVAALLLSLRYSEGKLPLKPTALRNALTAGATDLGPVGQDNITGLGLINPKKVLG